MLVHPLPPFPLPTAAVARLVTSELFAQSPHDSFAAASTAVSVAVTMLGLPFMAAAIAATVWVLNQQYILSLRRQSYARLGGKSRSIKPGTTAYLPPSQDTLWTRDEIAAFDGKRGDTPLLVVADNLVFNVASARHLYGPGAEYAAMAGNDATRMLAKNTLKPETGLEEVAPLTMAEQAALGVWVWSFKRKYDVVGKLASEEEAARMVQRKVLWDRMEGMGNGDVE
jgi:membrane-associated progesterone receptor component